MNPDEPRDMSADDIAAEYVIGTLNPTERLQARALIASDPEFAAQVGQWEHCLGELHALAGEVEPPPAIWDAIKARLPEYGGAMASAPQNGETADLRLRLARWRVISAIAGALVAVLASFIVATAIAPTLQPERLRPPSRVTVQTTRAPPSGAARYVAVLQREAVAPAFIVTVDIADRSLMVRRVAAEREPGTSYELWLISDRFPAPRSLGVVDSDDFTQSGNLSGYDPAVISGATFAVSLEPEGGSPTGAPSNMTFLGKLVEAMPSPLPVRTK